MLALGVAGYLGSGAGAGPTEAAALLVIVLLGPAVDLLARRVRLLDIHASSTAAHD